MDTISVVIPTYSAAPFIRETLDSVFGQTLLPHEVIVVDDCSTDNTVALVKEISKSASISVRVIRLPKNSGGPAKPLNVGIEAACGNLIATLDHDDTFAPNKLADQVPLLREHSDIGLVFGDLCLISPNSADTAAISNDRQNQIAAIPKVRLNSNAFLIQKNDAVRAAIQYQSFVSTCSNMLFRKSTWQAVDGFDESTTVSCDFSFLARTALTCDLAYVMTASANWMLHPSSFYSRSTMASRFDDILQIYLDVIRRTKDASLTSIACQQVHTISDETAYKLRQNGDHLAAAACLLKAIRIAGPWRKGVLSFGKLLPHYGYNLWNTTMPRRS
jgi:glycosyltransferase involved in cell wall biosynthesis